MAVPCLVCKQEIIVKYNQGIYTGDETTSVMFAGNAQYERGRYNIHERCHRPELSKHLLTMGQLEGKEAVLPLR